MKKIHCLTFLLVVVGGLNWLLTGLFQWGIGDLFGDRVWISRTIYILVGLATMYEVAIHKTICRFCGKGEGIN